LIYKAKSKAWARRTGAQSSQGIFQEVQAHWHNDTHGIVTSIRQRIDETERWSGCNHWTDW
jgi:hypothetical protein